MDKLKEIDEQIRQLNNTRAELIKEENNRAISSLEWTKHCFGRLEISPFSTAGIPKYEIFLYAPKDVIPYCSGSIRVMGDSNFYLDNMNFRYTEFGKSSCFYTSSRDMLFEFLENVIFDKFEFDNHTLETLARIDEIAKKYK